MSIEIKTGQKDISSLLIITKKTLIVAKVKIFRIISCALIDMTQIDRSL